MFSGEFLEISKNSAFYKAPSVAASALRFLGFWGSFSYKHFSYKKKNAYHIRSLTNTMAEYKNSN